MCWSRIIQINLVAGAICLWLVGEGTAGQQDSPIPTPEVKAQEKIEAGTETQVEPQQQIENKIQTQGEVDVSQQPRSQDNPPPRSQAGSREDNRNRERNTPQNELSVNGRAQTQVGLGAELENADEGLTISTMQENGIAAQAGLRMGDRIVSIDGREFDSQVRINAYLSQQERRNVPMIFIRDGQRYQTTIFAGPQLQVGAGFVQGRGRPAPSVERYDERAIPRAALGVELAPGPQGVVLTSIYPDSPAFVSGLWPQDEIVCINGWAAGGVTQFMSTVSQLPLDQPVPVRVIRDGRLISTTVNLVSEEQAFAGEPIRSREQLQARAETGAPPIPPRAEFQSEGEAPRELAQGANTGQRRFALRPDLEAMSREQLQREVESLRRENESLRQELDATQPQSDQRQVPPDAESTQDEKVPAPPPVPESESSRTEALPRNQQ